MGRIRVLNQPDTRYQHLPRRIRDLQREIDAHHASIARLKAFASGEATLKNKGYTWKAEHYRRRIDDAVRLPKTLQNLRFQIALMEKEIEILNRFQEG